MSDLQKTTSIVGSQMFDFISVFHVHAGLDTLLLFTDIWKAASLKRHGHPIVGSTLREHIRQQSCILPYRVRVLAEGIVNIFNRFY